MKEIARLWGHAGDLPLAHLREGLPTLVLNHFSIQVPLAHSPVGHRLGGFLRVRVSVVNAVSDRLA